MQAPDTLCKDFEAVHAFLNTHATTPALLHALPSLLQCHAASMQAKIENLGKIDMHAATRLVTTIAAGPWPDTIKAELSQSVNAKIGTTASTKAVMQQFSPDEYFTRGVMQKLEEPSMPMRSKIYELCAFMVALGVTHPTEPSIKACTGVLLMANYGTAALGMDGTAKYCILQDVKQMLRTVGNKAKPSAIQVYPSSVNEFREKYPHLYTVAYHSDPPIGHGLKASDLSLVTASIPMRKTNTAVTSASSPAASAPSFSSGSSVSAGACITHFISVVGGPPISK